MWSDGLLVVGSVMSGFIVSVLSSERSIISSWLVSRI